MRNRIIAVAILFIFVPMINATTVSIYKREESGLLTWSVETDGLKLEVIQLLPDFIRAIYEKHKFPQSEIDRVASYCVFGTILKNTSLQQLSYDINDWYYITKDGNQHKVKTKTKWLEEWQQAGILFSWTLLPDKGDFAVGDWQQGFTTIQLPREIEFDLFYKWVINGKTYNNVLTQLKCAPEGVPITS